MSIGDKSSPEAQRGFVPKPPSSGMLGHRALAPISARVGTQGRFASERSPDVG